MILFRFKRYRFINKLVLACICLGNIPTLAQPDYHHFIEYKYMKETYAIGSSDFSQLLTFIGMHKQALMEEERFRNEVFLKSRIVQPGVRSQNAYPFIFEAIKKNKIVILNECHNNPLSRVLLYTIIDSLDKFNVEALFMEALGYDAYDTSFVSAKLPFAYGIFTSENIFRQVLYKVKGQKVHLYSYEFQPHDLDTLSIQGSKCIVSKNDTLWIPVKVDGYVLENFLSKDQWNSREANQALKIFQKLKRNNIHKAFIYCGYAHAWREGNNMIDILEHLLEQNVYSIDQIVMNECINRNLEFPAYTKFANSRNPFVIVDSRNKPVKATASDRLEGKPLVDLIVGSPRSTYINNRPTWLELNGDRKRYNLSTFMDINTNKDFLVAFYTLDELKMKREEFIPDDVFQVLGTGANYDAILKPNQSYQLRVIKDKNIILNKTIHTN